MVETATGRPQQIIHSVMLLRSLVGVPFNFLKGVLESDIHVCSATCWDNVAALLVYGRDNVAFGGWVVYGRRDSYSDEGKGGRPRSSSLGAGCGPAAVVQ